MLLSSTTAAVLSNLIAMGGTARIRGEQASKDGVCCFAQKGLGSVIIPTLVRRGLVAYVGTPTGNIIDVQVTDAGRAL